MRRLVDPAVIEARAAAPDDEPELVDTAREQWRAGLRERLARAFKRLPPEEARALTMVAEGCSQEQIGRELGMSRLGALYRIHRAEERLRVIVQLPEYNAAQVRQVLAHVRGLDAMDIEIMSDYWETGCSSVTWRRLNLDQVVADTRLNKGITRLRASAEVTGHADLCSVLHGFVLLRKHRGLFLERKRARKPRPR